MKKIITILLAALTVLPALSQGIKDKLFEKSIVFDKSAWISTSKNHLKLSLETTRVCPNSVTYGYADISHDYQNNSSNSGNYVQIFREQKFWELPLYLHGEFRMYNGFDGFHTHTGYIGAAYTFNFSHGFIAPEPLMMLVDEDKLGFQFSLVGDFAWKYTSFSFFYDYMANHGDNDYLELRLWIHPLENTSWKNLKIGTIGCISPMNKEGEYFLALKYSF